MSQFTGSLFHRARAGGRRPRRQPRRALVGLAVVALLAATLAIGAPGPVAADGNEAPGAPLAARSITAGQAHTCAIVPNGSVKCWGFNVYGQLGQDSTATLGDQAGEMAALPAVNLGAGRTATAISAGYTHTCALLDNGTVKCWGRNSNGQLGQDSTANLGDQPGEMAALPAVNLGAGRTATAVSAGYTHTCALLDNGTVKCWGANDNGQLGQDSTANLGDQPGEMAALPAVNLGAGRTATAVSAGNGYTCALLDNGTVKCWGWNLFGALGQDSTATLGDQAGEMAALPAVNLGAGRTATAISADSFYTCALLDNGTVKCWGYNNKGQLGQDSTANLGDQAGEMAALPAVNLGAGRTATAISAGGSHTCAVLDNGTVKCWGNGASGRLGQDSTATLGDQAGEVAALPAVNLGAGRTATAVAAAMEGHTCAVLDNATVKCWGEGSTGQLGQDSTANLGDQPGEMAALQPILLVSPWAMTVAKTADETTVAVRGVIHLHVTVTNTGTQDLHAVTIDDPHEASCEVAPFNLAIGANHVVDCTHRATEADVGTYSNTASATATEITTPVTSNTVNVTVTVPAGFGTVSGTVTDSVTSAPIAGADIGVLSPADFSLVGFAIADSSGNYQTVAPVGSYFVYALAPPNHIPGFVGSPTTVAVTAGNTTDVDPVLVPSAGTATGTVTETGSGDPLAGVAVIAINGSGAPMGTAATNASGGFTVSGLPAGTYRARMIDPAFTHAITYYGGTPDYGAATTFVITGGATTTGINTALPTV